jgi:hypothetical protein
MEEITVFGGKDENEPINQAQQGIEVAPCRAAALAEDHERVRLATMRDRQLLSEPMPSRTDRRAVLLYEATEGGAGVLARLAREREAPSSAKGASTASAKRSRSCDPCCFMAPTIPFGGDMLGRTGGDVLDPLHMVHRHEAFRG